METNSRTTHEQMIEEIHAHPDYLYTYNPTLRPGAERYVFTDRTLIGTTSAYLRCMEDKRTPLTSPTGPAGYTYIGEIDPGDVIEHEFGGPLGPECKPDTPGASHQS